MNKNLVRVVLHCFSFLIISSGHVKSQNRHEIDSIKTLNKVESNPEKLADNYNQISKLFSDYNIDSAYFYAYKALEISKENEYKLGEADAYYWLSFYNDRTKKQEDAIRDLKNAIELYEQLKDTTNLAICYNNLGVFYSYGADQTTSLEYFIKAMNLAESTNETFALSEAYANIGSYYEYLEEYVSALKYYNKALEVDLKANNRHNIALSYITVGSINIKLQRFDNARDSLLKARMLISQVDDNYRKTELYIYLASAFIETGQLDSAQIQIQKAKELNSKEKYERLTADILTEEADLCFKQKNYNHCLQLYDKAIQIYTQQKTFDVLYDIYLNKSKAYSELGRHERAYEILQQAQKLKDDSKPNELAKLLGEFEYAEELKEERAKLQLEQEVMRQKNEKEVILIRAKLRFAIFSIVFLVVIIVMIVYFYFLIRKQNSLLEENYKVIENQKVQLEQNYLELKSHEKKLSELNATKDKFFSIIAHDLKNPFNVLIGLSDVVISDPEIKNTEDFNQIMEGIFETAKSGYNLLDNLLEWARSQTGDLKYKPEVLDMNQVLSLNTQLFNETAKAKEIIIDNLIPADQKVFADYNMLNFIVRNLLNNAIKFSFPKGKVELKLTEENDFKIFTIQDFGTGMNKETREKLFQIENADPKPGTANETGSGLGLIICKEFIKRHGGDIWAETEEGKGSSFHFSLPTTGK